MPRISCCGSGILPFASCAISLRIWPNCLTSWLTACTVVPDPRAIRFRREPSIRSGLRALLGRHREDDRLEPVELAIVHVRPGGAASSPCPCRASSRARSPSGPMRRTWRICCRKSSSVNSWRADLALQLLGLLGVGDLLGLLDQRQHVAHAEDSDWPSAPGESARAGRASRQSTRRGSACRSPPSPTAPPRRGRRRRASSARRRRSRPARRTTRPRSPRPGRSSRPAPAGRRGAWSACGSLPARPSAPRRCAGDPPCRRSATSSPAPRAWPSAHSAISTGSRSVPCSYTVAPACPPTVTSCSTAAGRCVSQATRADLLALLAQQLGELRAGGRLARPLKPGEQDHGRAGAREREVAAGAAHQLRELLVDDLHHLLAGIEAVQDPLRPRSAP